MKKIVLVCAAGMSTSILLKKMKEAAEKMEFKCTIEAHPVAEVKEVGKAADIVLLGPQVGFQLSSVKAQVECPAEVIDMIAYGTMDGSKIIKHVKEVIGE
jgi:PTS system cellobiose-specific IIB component